LVFFSLRLETVSCNKSAIRLRAVDLPELAKGAVKSVIGLRVCREPHYEEVNEEQGKRRNLAFLPVACYSNKELPIEEVFCFSKSRKDYRPNSHFLSVTYWIFLPSTFSSPS
jgi:hypothetical protein